MAAAEYRGDEFIFAIEIEDDNGEEMIRPFNQTGGSTSIEADEIELDTKDKTGSDYGKITQEISLEGLITEGDDFPDYVKKSIRGKEFVKVYEINTRTKKTEVGMYMVTSFEREYENGEFATYSFEGTLNGDICEFKLGEVPEGPESSDGGIDCDDEEEKYGDGSGDSGDESED